MKIKVSEAKGVALDWLVAKCEGKKVGYEFTLFSPVVIVGLDPYEPSEDWAQGGPIIDRERIATSYHPNPFQPGWEPWRASFAAHSCGGPTPLIAAMRCWVASKLGDEVEIPEELK